MTESGTPPVADRSWRVRLLVMDGVLIALLGWLLYIVVAERATNERAENNETPLEAPRNP